jgi:predicted dehydrogenase
VNAVPGLQLSYIVQRQGNEAALAYPDATILRSFVEALSSDADLIVVGSPDDTHYSFAKRCLEVSKHVVVDKPFAATSKEAATLAKLAAENSLILAPYQNRRWDGDFLTVSNLIEQKAVGRLVTLESHFDRFDPVPNKNSWREKSHPGDGLMFDLGSHLVDQVLTLFGQPQKISASIRKDRDNSQIEDAFDIYLHYPQLLASCHSSLVACDASPRFLLHGLKGSYTKHGLDPQEDALVAGRQVPRFSENDGWLSEDESLWGVLTVISDAPEKKELVKKKVKTLPGDYRGYYMNVRDAILGVAPLAVRPEHSYRLLRIFELARESSNSGQTLPVVFEM